MRAFFVLNIFKLCVDVLTMQKKLSWKDNVDFKNHGVTTWLTYNYNTHIFQYFKT